MKTDDGCQRTVQILKNVGKRDLIMQFAKWVLIQNPSIGLTLFEESKKPEEQNQI